jgi:hypothetical protein
MEEDILLEDFETITSNVHQMERVRIKKKAALFVPRHNFFRNETIEDLRRNGHLPYPSVKMPSQPTGFIKGRDNDCL